MTFKKGILGLGMLFSLTITTIFSSGTMSYHYGSKAYSEKFSKAIKVIFAHEGGYVDDPHDKGGESKYGISQRRYPNLDISALTRQQAEAIYYRDFWQAEHFEQINNLKVITKVFDLSVNVGPGMAAKIVQRALRSTGNAVAEDGVLGLGTVAAINRADASDLLAALKSETAGYYRMVADNNPGQQKFLKGWLNRAYS